MNIRYRVTLGEDEREELQALLSGGRHAVRKLKRAQILLAANAGIIDKEIAGALGVNEAVSKYLPTNFSLAVIAPIAGDLKKRPQT